MMESESLNNTLASFLAFNELETPEKMREVARKELGETEEVKAKCIQKLKELIRENNVATITRDDFLLRFLRTKKFHVQRSFEALQNYSRMRASFHERLLKLPPEVLEKCLRRPIFGFLAYRDADQRITIFFDTGSWNPSICSDDDLAMVILILVNYIAEKESSQVTGFNTFFDCNVIPLRHIPYLMRHIGYVLRFAFNCLPARYRKVHFINEPPLLKYVLRVLDPLLPKKIKERIILHGKTRDVLFQHYSPCILPDAFGGTLGPLNNDHLIDVLLDHFQQMKDEQKYFLPQNC